MRKKFLASLLVLGFALQASIGAFEGMDDLNSPEAAHRGHNSRHSLRNFAVLSNQTAVLSGQSILWTLDPSTPAPVVNPSGIVVNSAGLITLPRGVYLVQYSVRITRTPFAGTAQAVVQLQQTVAGVPTNIINPAITTTTTIDGITETIPQSDTEITGYAIINAECPGDNAIDLFVFLTPGGNLTIPATTGTDANAQISIIQLR